MVEVSDDCVEMLQHYVGVVGSEGQGGSEPDARLPATPEVDAELPEVVDYLVPQLQADHVHCTESSKTSSSGENLRESLLEVLEAPHYGLASLVDTLKQRIFFYNFDDLRIKEIKQQRRPGQ